MGVRRTSTYTRDIPSNIRRSFEKPIKSIKEYLKSKKDGKFYVREAKIKDTYHIEPDKPDLDVSTEKIYKNRRIGMDELMDAYKGKPPKDLAEAFSQDLSDQKLKLIGPAVYGGGITASGVAMYKKKKDKKMIKKASDLTVLEYLEKKASSMMYGQPLTKKEQQKLDTARKLYTAGNVAGSAGNVAMLASIPMSMLSKTDFGRKAAGYTALGGVTGILGSYGLRGLGSAKYKKVQDKKRTQALKQRLQEAKQGK